MIYVIRALGTPFLKIGYTADMDCRERLHTMQTGCPYQLRLKAFGPGDRRDELEYHIRLKQLGVHHRGEWFRSCRATDEIIECLNQSNKEHNKAMNDAAYSVEGQGRLGRVIGYAQHIASHYPKRRSRTARTPKALQPNQGAV